MESFMTKTVRDFYGISYKHFDRDGKVVFDSFSYVKRVIRGF